MLGRSSGSIISEWFVIIQPTAIGIAMSPGLPSQLRVLLLFSSASSPSTHSLASISIISALPPTGYLSHSLITGYAAMIAAMAATLLTSSPEINWAV
jgi:hypothetical protein